MPGGFRARDSFGYFEVFEIEEVSEQDRARVAVGRRFVLRSERRSGADGNVERVSWIDFGAAN